MKIDSILNALRNKQTGHFMLPLATGDAKRPLNTKPSKNASFLSHKKILASLPPTFVGKARAHFSLSVSRWGEELNKVGVNGLQFFVNPATLRHKRSGIRVGIGWLVARPALLQRLYKRGPRVLSQRACCVASV